MIRIELPTLISKLNEQSKLALEQAASLCIEQQQPEVTLAHYMDVLLDNPLSDLRTILQHANIDHNALKAAIKEDYTREHTLDTFPPFSPLLVEALQEAWLISTTELNQTELRSGAIFVIALASKERYLNLAVRRLLEPLTAEALKREFELVVANSSETPVVSDDKSVKQPLLAGGQQSLEKYCKNITQDAEKGELDPVLCRDNEINLMIDILCRRRKNNPIVVGEAGVGKSALIEGLAQRIASDNVPERLKGVTIMSLDLGLLQAGASVKGEFEKRLKGVIEEVKQSANPIILFIDEAHTLVGAGGDNDAANLLKPALARGEISTIAATTWKEYKKYFEKDAALTRRFEVVKVDEPSVDQTIDILRGLHHVYEKAHTVLISETALQAASQLSARYLSGRQLPDKAIDVLDTACARIAINLSSPPKRLAQLETQSVQRQREIDMLERAKLLGEEVDGTRLDELHTLHDVENDEYQELHQAWQQQQEMVQGIIEARQIILGFDSEEDEQEILTDAQQSLRELTESFEALSTKELLIHPQVDEEQIAEVIADWTGVPIDQMKSDELNKITQLADTLRETIKGQDIAIERVHKNLLTARADLRRAGRPKGAFLLVGPSGVGKTETVVQLANQLYGGKQFLTTINMSEYQEKHTVSRLIGSPPGYVGYGEGGVLTEAIRKKPYSVVLLDEVEKAHPEVLNLFYQAFDKGELADGEGRLIDCQNIVFFLTSNLGYQAIVQHNENPEVLDEALYPILADFFKPALLARMETIPYLPLDKSVLAEIVAGKLSRLEQIFSQRYGAEVVIEESVIELILQRANRSENGARMLEAIIDGQVLPPISLALLTRLANQEPVNQVTIRVEDDEFVGEVK